jgi:hypothetical protein
VQLASGEERRQEDGGAKAELRWCRRGPPRQRVCSLLGGHAAAERRRDGALTALEPQICARWVISGGLPLVRTPTPN